MAVITRKKYPFLFRVLDKKEIREDNATDAMDLHGIRGFNKVVKNGLSDVSVSYVSMSFLSDAGDNYPKLVDLCSEINDGKYCFLVKDDVYFFTKKDNWIELHVAKGYDILYWGIGYIGETVGFKNMYDNVRNESKHAIAQIPVAVLLFKQFAETEIKVIPPNGKVKDFHCRYKSDLPIPIQRLDLNWYTESCKNHPFVVRGHWRMQPHGKGRKEVKLKYIDPYMKTGYTKGAYMND
jgi:hypothetical protein